MTVIPSRFRVHPAIGIARVGNADVSPDGSSTEGFFIGPETPGVPANWDLEARRFSGFKAHGKIKRQGARFRVWEYEERNGRMVPLREVTLDDARIASIEWTVDVANTKASFFEFHGRAGSSDDFKGDYPRRNAGVLPTERADRLEIRPPAQPIHGRCAAPVELRNPNARIPIGTLGQLRTDEQGRLIVLGGLGQATSSPDLPAPSPHAHPVPIYDFANNWTWFDDVSDGRVSATITLRDSDGGITADGAWVIVGPPDFAPAIPSVITLYDLLVDMAVRELPIPGANGLFTEYAAGRGLARLAELKAAWESDPRLSGYRPSYAKEILPIFSRAALMPWVHDAGYSFHEWLTPAYLGSLGANPGRPEVRQALFAWLRDPEDSKARPWRMPRAFADDYEETPPPGRDLPPSRYLALTHIQYALLRRWAQGEFVSDYDGPIEIPLEEDISAEGLDRAAVESCPGGGFFPGMEVSWLIRKPQVFSEPFRIDAGAKLGPLTVSAGFFSQQMALPWHADFWECRKEGDPEAAGAYQSWWPANRPDDVRRAVSEPALEWARDMTSGDDMVTDWSKLGFVIRAGDAFLEKEGPPA